MATATAEQFELIEDDPRIECTGMDMIRQWRAARKEHGELVARGFAAQILGVSSGQVAVWCTRGRLSDIVIGSIKAVALDEVVALRKERMENELSVGGYGKKMPSMAEVVRASLKE